MPQVSEEEKKRIEEDLLRNHNLSEEDRRRIKRRASNRESARRTRLKRTEKLKQSEERCAFLKAENTKIIQQIHELEKLYFDAVLHNRTLKSDIHVIRTANPHLNTICPPAVHTSSSIPLPTSHPFTSDLFPSSVPSAGGPPPPAPLSLPDQAMLNAESTSMASMLASIPGMPMDLLKFSGSMAELQAGQALPIGAPLPLGASGTMGMPASFPTSSTFQELVDASKNPAQRDAAPPGNFTSMLQQPGNEGSLPLNVASLMPPGIMMYPATAAAARQVKPDVAGAASASMPMLPEAPALDALSAPPQVPPAGLHALEYAIPMASQPEMAQHPIPGQPEMAQHPMMSQPEMPQHPMPSQPEMVQHPTPFPDVS